jgi:hypothetical protein
MQPIFPCLNRSRFEHYKPEFQVRVRSRSHTGQFTLLADSAQFVVVQPSVHSAPHGDE